MELQTTNLDSTFRALIDRKEIPPLEAFSGDNYSRGKIGTTTTYAGSGMMKTASVQAPRTIYGQPTFFSPVHTPINWQIPSKRLEIYQWCRFFYNNEPKVAAAIDFYSRFPVTSWTHECSDRNVKNHFDKLAKRLKLKKWTQLISHEVHMLGDCFPFQEITCPHCRGSGKIGDYICDHEGGTVRRLVVLNPDYVDILSPPMSPEPIVALRPDEELIQMVQRQLPGYDKLSPDLIKMIQSGQPIRLDNRNVSHLMYGESPYHRYGNGLIRRLFPILSYKTKLMVAQWVVAERLILPIKVVKIGSEERPAGPADIAEVQSQLAQTAQDPNLTIVTQHAFDIDFVGAAGKILTISNEFELINQEILDGMMLNNALINGEGPQSSGVTVGVEVMIRRLQAWQEEAAEWIEEEIYLPEAMRQGFIDKNPDTGEEEYIVPKIKWGNMNLRDQQNDRQNAFQLYEKGLLSGQTVLEVFDYDPDVEIERKRYDVVQMMALGEQGAEGPGGMGGGFGGGGMPDLGGLGGLGGGGGMPELGGMGGEAPPISAGEGPMTQTSSFQAEVANPGEFGGKVLKKKTRERLQREQDKVYQEQQKAMSQVQPNSGNQSLGGPHDPIRDSKGRIVYTKNERELMRHLIQHRKDGLIKYQITPQYEVKSGKSMYLIDFAIPQLKLGIEADGEMFHSTDSQIRKDKERDLKLSQQGWTIIRFKDSEIEKQPNAVMQTIIANIAKKEKYLQEKLDAKNENLED